ncbi:MAG: AAA family ATPase, partial [Bacteroidales bacterium]|nr:AAA family ATPase [Bacteroidales bacterium]
MERIFKRKLYDRLLEWKRIQKGKTAILIEGARRVGKSTLVEQFAKNEYESYILIDFIEASDEVKDLFSNLMNKDFIFLQLQSIYNVVLIERKSV